MTNENSNDKDFRKFDKASHDLLGKFYDYAKADPDAKVMIANLDLATKDVFTKLEQVI